MGRYKEGEGRRWERAWCEGRVYVVVSGEAWEVGWGGRGL